MITLDALPDAVLTALRAHVGAAYPREACGVVLQAGDRFEALPCRNADPEPRHRFALDLRDLLLIARRRAAGESLVAIYHSHCDGPAVFSKRDRQYAAAYLDQLHVVFAVTARGVLAVHGFAADGTPLDAPVEVPA